MRGKLGLVVGIGIGYVLGTRAGRERYEQIKTQALKVWNLDPVQDQVDKVKDFAKSSAVALPKTLWNTAVKVTKAASNDRGTTGERLNAAIKTGKQSADEVARAARTTQRAAKAAADDAVATADAATRTVKRTADKAVDSVTDADGS